MDANISVAVALGAFFIWALVVWNRLVKLKAEVSAALARLDAEALRLRDLVPSLERMARPQLAHESATLAAVAEASEAAQAAATIAADAFSEGEALAARAAAEKRLSAAVNRMLAAVEDHPQLKTDEPLQQVVRELTIGDDRLGVMRQSYNQAVASYNTALQAFPAVMFASMLGFRPAMPLE